jgi:hypothetical protein
MMRKCALLLALAALMGATVAVEADDTAKKRENKEMKLTCRKVTPAATVNFAGDLELNFASLKKLGSRIDSAREQVDPVDLVSAAIELAAAEKVSGKTSSIKAADLLKEGLDLAKLRRHPDELKAIALLVTDKEQKEELQVLAKEAKKRLAGLKANTGKSKGITGTLYIVNRTRHTIHIAINGEARGHVMPWNTRGFFVGDSDFDQTTMNAWAAGGFSWGPYTFRQRHVNWTFTFN